VIRSRFLRTLTRRTQKALTSLWKVTPLDVRHAGPQRREALEGNELLLVDVLVSEISR
jgi:hypothetical protein